MKRVDLILAFLAILAPQAVSAAQQDRIVLPTNTVPERYTLAVAPDATAMTFAGSVTIDVEVRNPTTTIVLNAADLAFRRVSLDDTGGTPKTVFDSTAETATLTFPQTVSAGHHKLAIEYTGKINPHAAGLFALDYDTRKGKKRALFTQFENSDARRFLPCWDEPAHKAVFVLTATVPGDEMAVSNTPIASSESLPGGLKRVHFAVTPKMSSYLLFFGLGDFERISRKVNGVDVGVIVKRGDTARGEFALDAAAHILPFYEDYFAVKYPLPKLDLIAGPGESQFFGAMENWGAIFYFERDLLLDPHFSTETDRRGVYITVAHEMAHQWFGDLVTMAWWDDLWLNEGFASWMEYKATDHFHPEWNVWLRSLTSKEGAMRTDARNGTHPIIQPIRDVLQANQAFDVITYSKGQAVIRMLENYVGADAFRDGVRRYIKAHAYGNTVSDDLWRELDKTSPAPVTLIAHDFTLHSGVPLLRVSKGAESLRVTEDRYTEDGSGKKDARWHVPVVAGSPGTDARWRGMVSGDSTTDIPKQAGSVVIVNRGQSGYFRTLYDPASLTAIAAQFPALDPADQLGLLNDTRALGYAGYTSVGDFLSLASGASADLDPMVIDTIASRLEALDFLYEGLPGQSAFRAFGRRVLGPAQSRFGMKAHPGEGPNAPIARGSVLSALSEFDDPTVIGEARRAFAMFLKDPSSLSGDERRSVLEIVALHADGATWDQIHALARQAPTSLEKHEFYILLGTTHDEALATRALDLALTDEMPVTTRPSMLGAVSEYHPRLALAFLSAHFDTFNRLLEPDSRTAFAPGLASGAHDMETLAMLRRYADAHIPANARNAEQKAESAIVYAAKVRDTRLPEADKWLAAHANR
ncbi:MAG TPA: M1 family metallopeptidase [Rhizomicrobium sp.]|jgi:aminopeptidase N